MSKPARQIIVVREGDVFLRDLGGIPSPMLLDLCNDGRAHEAWANVYPGRKPGEESVQWRARDDEYDAVHKPASTPYVRVIAGRNPYYKDSF
jgi:hypothetical protein